MPGRTYFEQTFDEAFEQERKQREANMKYKVFTMDAENFPEATEVQISEIEADSPKAALETVMETLDMEWSDVIVEDESGQRWHTDPSEEVFPFEKK